MTWQETIRNILRRPAPDEYEFTVFKVRPPKHQPWPAYLVESPPLQEFYRLCDGGYIAHMKWAGISEIAELTAQWIARLRDYDERGDVLDVSKDVVFGTDAAGCPIIWSSSTRVVRSFFFKGGDWEPLAPSFEEFVTNVFVSDPEPSDWQRFVRFYHRAPN